MLDYRFPTAMQMVFCIAQSQKAGQRCTSAILATGLEANSSFIRKLMVPLTQHGIIVSTLGRTGSITLGRPAEDISFATSIVPSLKINVCGPRARMCLLVVSSAPMPALTSRISSAKQKRHHFRC